MTMRYKIANWLTRGRMQRLIDECNRAQFDAHQAHDLTETALNVSKQITDALELKLSEQQAIIRAQRQALDQIAAELTDLIDMPQHRRTTTALRAIRALTKGPHK